MFHVLLALVAGATHGYGIMQEIERFTNGQVRLGNATLYRTLQRLAVDGLVEEFSDPAALSDERRREYRLTRVGLRAAQAETTRYRDVVLVARRLGLLESPGGKRKDRGMQRAKRGEP